MQFVIRTLAIALSVIAMYGCAKDDPTSPPVFANNNGPGTQQVCIATRDVECTTTPAPVVVVEPVVLEAEAPAEE